MSRKLFRLLTTGYGLAAMCGVALWLAGAGALAAGLTFWIGGAAAVLAAAAIQTGGRPAAAERGDTVAGAEELMRWERDRSRDAAQVAEDREDPARRVV